MKQWIMTQKKKAREKGQSLVEFSVSLVVILVILAGVVDLGRMFFYYIAMRDAAQEGVVYGAAFPTDCTNIVARSRALLSSSNPTVSVLINGMDCTAAKAADTALGGSGPLNACSPNTIEVFVKDDNFTVTMPFLGGIVGNTIKLNASINGTILRPQCNN
ncbi:MAG: TadE family protein [Anaerolineaceae bacterium]